jgi:hypothetical protein
MNLKPLRVQTAPIHRRAFSVLAPLAGLLACVSSADAQCPVSFAPAVFYASPGFPSSVAVGDFNADGKLDLQVTNANANTVRCFLGTGTGTFTTTGQVGVGLTPYSVAVADFSGDGRPDFVTANYGSSNVSIRLGLGSGFTSGPTNFAVEPGPFTVVIGDFNGDGKSDLAVANATGWSVAVLLGNGDGTFAPAVHYQAGFAPTSVAVGDFNGDGKSDLAIANSSSANISILTGAGDGTFIRTSNVPAGMSPEFVLVGDFNRDGRADLAISGGGTSVSVLLGNGNGTFAAPLSSAAGSGARAMAMADFNGDGLTDLAVVNQYDNNVSILLGTGTGAFAPPANFAVGFNPFSVAAGDFNGDGKPDLVTTNRDGDNISVLINNSPGNPTPVFTLQPVSRVVQTGSTISFTAVASPFGAATPYRWRRNGQPLSDGGNISGATTNTLTISPATASDMASYDVQAINGLCNGVQTGATSAFAVLAVTPSPVPVNDACAQATHIGNGAITFSTVNATTDGPNEANLGFGAGNTQINQDVWFIYTATCTGTVTVSLCGSNFNTKLAVYNGATCPTGPNTAIAGNDDSSVCGAASTQSRTTFESTAGSQYLIRIGGFSTGAGNVNMSVSCAASAVCNFADIAGLGGTPGSDGRLTADDVVFFLSEFFSACR